MAYCALTDVQALIPTNVWDYDAEGAAPTQAEVTEFISDVDAEIDAKLSSRYTTPITGAEALKVVSAISARLVAMRVWGVVLGQVGDARVPEDWKRAITLLDDLAAGSADLSDAGSVGGGTVSAPGSPEHTFPPLKRRTGELDEDESIFRMDDIY